VNRVLAITCYVDATDATKDAEVIQLADRLRAALDRRNRSAVVVTSTLESIGATPSRDAAATLAAALAAVSAGKPAN
jgi:hypothetical protein